jgi:hypothetical protein
VETDPGNKYKEGGGWEGYPVERRRHREIVSLVVAATAGGRIPANRSNPKIIACTENVRVSDVLKRTMGAETRTGTDEYWVMGIIPEHLNTKIRPRFI